MEQPYQKTMNGICIGIAVFMLWAAATLAFAEGQVYRVGAQKIWTCDYPTTYQSGGFIPAATVLTIRLYQTQVPAQIGTEIYAGTDCSFVQFLDLPEGQWYIYATAEEFGRGESVLSDAVPFVLDSFPPTNPPANLRAVDVL